jgi:hypothetical protein
MAAASVWAAAHRSHAQINRRRPGVGGQRHGSSGRTFGGALVLDYAPLGSEPASMSTAISSARSAYDGVAPATQARLNRCRADRAPRWCGMSRMHSPLSRFAIRCGSRWMGGQHQESPRLPTNSGTPCALRVDRWSAPPSTSSCIRGRSGIAAASILQRAATTTASISTLYTKPCSTHSVQQVAASSANAPTTATPIESFPRQRRRHRRTQCCCSTACSSCGPN